MAPRRPNKAAAPRSAAAEHPTLSGRVPRPTEKASNSSLPPATSSSSRSKRGTARRPNPRRSASNLAAAVAAPAASPIEEEDDEVLHVPSSQPQSDEPPLHPQEQDLHEQVQQLKVQLLQEKIKTLEARADNASASSSRRPVDEVDEFEPERVSFKNVTPAGKSELSSLMTRFGVVDQKLFQKIFKGSITTADLAKFTPNQTHSSATVFRDITHLMESFILYMVTVCTLAVPGSQAKLYWAMSMYHMRILKFSQNHTFESVRDFHTSFVQDRIHRGQDIAEDWEDSAVDKLYMLRPRHTPQRTPYSQANSTYYNPSGASPYSAPSWGAIETCHRFNSATCERGASCKYRHTCRNCGGEHAAKHCPSATDANVTPLGDRVRARS